MIEEKTTNTQQDDGIVRKNSPERRKIYLSIAVGILILAVAGTVAFMVINGKGGGNGNASTTAMLPIWVAVFIPILAANKSKKPLSESQKRGMLILVTITLLLVLGTLSYVLYRTMGTT